MRFESRKTCGAVLLNIECKPSADQVLIEYDSFVEALKVKDEASQMESKVLVKSHENMRSRLWPIAGLGG